MFHNLNYLPASQCTENVQGRLSPMLQLPHCCRSGVHTAVGLPLMVLDPTPCPHQVPHEKGGADYEHLDKVKIRLLPCIDMLLN